MFVLQINEINPHSFCFVSCFLFIFTREALPNMKSLHTILCIAYLRICSENLPWVFYMFKRMLCCVCEQILLYGSKTFWFVRFSLLTVFYFIIVVAVMGHRKKAHGKLIASRLKTKNFFYTQAVLKERIILFSDLNPSFLKAGKLWKSGKLFSQTK